MRSRASGSKTIAPRSRRRVGATPGAEPLEGRRLLTSAAFQLVQDWGSGFGGQVTIRNTAATPVAKWSLAFDFDRSITSIWDGQIASHVGNHYVVTGAGWNNDIAAGGSAAFGFNGSPGNLGADQPTGYTLNGVALGGPTAPPATPSLSAADATVREGGTAGTTPIIFAVSLSAASTSTVTVHYATADGTAKAGTNYQATSGTLTFSPGVTSRTVAVPVINDLTPATNRTFGLVLSAPTAATIGRATATGTIVDTVAPPDRPPVAVADSAAATTASPTTIAVLANDSDPDGDPIAIASFAQPAHGAVALGSGGTLVYTSVAGFVGNDSFTYTISDGRGMSATAGVTVAVAAPAPPPPAPAAGAWPAHVYAPYVDMTLYPTYNLAATSQAQGLRYFTLAFIVADPANNAPSWGGYGTYDVNGGDFDRAIRGQLASLRQLGGDASVSFGGAAGQELAQTISTVPALTAAYEQVIGAYGLTHVDFDIEGAAVADHASIDRRSQAIAAAQRDATAAGRPLAVSFTLPVLPTGLTGDGLYVVQSALKYGVKVGGVNAMTMDFGDYAAPQPAGRMASYVIQAGQSVFNQLQGVYGASATDAQLWSMIGLTPMIGVNDVSSETFTLDDARQVLAWARSKGVGRISIWSLNRDVQDPNGALTYAESTSSSIVQAPFAFSTIFAGFTSN